MLSDYILNDYLCFSYKYHWCFCRYIDKQNILLLTLLINLSEICIIVHDFFWIRLKPDWNDYPVSSAGRNVNVFERSWEQIFTERTIAYTSSTLTRSEHKTVLEHIVISLPAFFYVNVLARNESSVVKTAITICQVCQLGYCTRLEICKPWLSKRWAVIYLRSKTLTLAIIA